MFISKVLCILEICVYSLIGKVWKEWTKLIFLGHGIYIVDRGENFTFCFFSKFFFLYQTFFEKTSSYFHVG